MTFAANGTSGGTTSTSVGNVFLSTYSDSAYQRWEIVDSLGVALETDEKYFNGIYYINDSASGKFVQQKANLLGGISGLVNYLGSSIKWKITPIGKDGFENQYVIQPVSDTSLFLMSASLSASEPSLGSISTSNIPDNCKWVINGWGIRNVASKKYLRFGRNSSGTAYHGELSADRNTDSRWRIFEAKAYEAKELKKGFSFSVKNAFVGEKVEWVFSEDPQETYCINSSDFIYTVITQSDPNSVTIDSKTGSITANCEGKTVIRAKHRVTMQACEFTVNAEYRSVIVPVAFASGSSYNRTLAFPVYLEYYLENHSSLLNGVTWKAFENGVISFDSQNMTVTGKAPGYAWLEASKNGKTVFICYVYTDNVFKDIDQISVRDYLYSSGTALGTMSCLTYEQDHKIDPLVLRVEWYLYAVELLNRGMTDADIRDELNRKFGLSFESDDMFQLFIAEVDHGSQGGYAREKIKMSLEGLRSLFNFYWMQYAMYTIANLDTVNVYTPATEMDVAIENASARQMCNSSRKGLIDIYRSSSKLSLDYQYQVDPNIRNEIWFKRYGSTNNPPYPTDAPVIKYKTSKDTKFIRFFSDKSKPAGNWVCNPEDIKGLSIEEIREKLALPNNVTQMCDITVPSGEVIYVGRVNSAFGFDGKGIQYELENTPLTSWISNLRNI